MSGDAATHDKKVGDALKQLSTEVDVIVLAQASMARVVDTLSDADKKVPILASPPIAMEYLSTILNHNTLRQKLHKSEFSCVVHEFV